MSLGELLRTTVTLKRRATLKDAAGGSLETGALVAVSGYSDIPCDIQPADGTVRLQYMQAQLFITDTILSEIDIPVKAEDILVSNGGRTFQFRGRKPIAEGYETDQWPAEIHVEELLG